MAAPLVKVILVNGRFNTWPAEKVVPSEIKSAELSNLPVNAPMTVSSVNYAAIKLPFVAVVPFT